MPKFIGKNVHRASDWYVGAQQRAQRRRSPWNLILIPLGLAAGSITWYGLFRVVWVFHLLFYPQHMLRDFWSSGISISSFILSFLMVFAIAPGALCAGFVAANGAAWMIRPARRTFNAESVGHPGTGFMDSTRPLLLCVVWAVPTGLVIAIVAAGLLTSLR